MSEIYNLEKYIPIVCSQTNYKKEEAEEKLEKWNGDYIKVIKDYLNITNKTPIKKTLNQEIYKEIRTFLNT